MALPGTAGFLFASNDTPTAGDDLAPSLFPEAALTEFVDRKRGLYRAAAFVDGRLEGALFLGPADAPPQWGDLRQMVGGPGIAESGQVVCACFGVGVAAIAEAWRRARPRASTTSPWRCAREPNAAPACPN